MIYLRLVYEFFKTGLFALGGGLATIPFLYRMSERFGWFSKGDIVNMLAVSESTPGAIGVNMATYSGFHLKGVTGALLATFGLVLPSVIIILIVARMLDSFEDNEYVKSGFYGIRPVVAGLICSAALQVFKVAFLLDANRPWKSFSDLDLKALIFFVILYIGVKLLDLKGKSIHPIILIVFSGCMGILLLGA